MSGCAQSAASVSPGAPTSRAVTSAAPGSAEAGTDAVTIRVVLPAHLRTLAGISGETSLTVPGRPSLEAALDALESAYPVLRGTVRDQGTKRRRAFVRFFACEQDLSHVATDEVLPEPVLAGKEPLLVIGAMAGG